MNKTDRIGERNYNTFGSEMVIVEYRKANNIDVCFPQYDWIAKNTRYGDFKNGEIKCPYEPRVYKIGYLGEGEYKCRENGKLTRVYNTWVNMLQRCYSEEYHKRQPTYKDCEILEKWYNFQNFAKWYDENYYEVDGETMCLDKDILFKHNKIYSPETCIFVPETINKLFVKRQNNRGKSVIGTSFENGKYRARCNLLNPGTGKSKNEYLGYYDTELEAFEIYKYHKERNIKQVADYYFGRIPEKLYQGLYTYEVEIDD